MDDLEEFKIEEYEVYEGDAESHAGKTRSHDRERAKQLWSEYDDDNNVMCDQNL